MASDIPGVIHRYRRWPLKFCLWYMSINMSLDLSLVHREDHDGREEETFACSDAATEGWGEPVEPKLSCCRWSSWWNWQGPSTSSRSSTIPKKSCPSIAQRMYPHILDDLLTYVWCLLVQYPTGAGEGSREAGHWIFAGKLAENLSAERTGRDLLRKNDWNRITLTDETVQNVLCAASMSFPSKLLARATGYPGEDIATRNWAPGSLLWGSCLT